MKKTIIFIALFLVGFSYAQNTTTTTTIIQTKEKSDFWKRVRFGGGLNLSFGNTTVIGISPQANYMVNDRFSVGAGVGYQYIKSGSYSQNIFSINGLAFYNIIQNLQLSANLEQNFASGSFNGNVTSLFLGAGYRPSPNITIGMQYDVLHNDNKSIYSSPFMPFVRVYF